MDETGADGGAAGDGEDRLEAPPGQDPSDTDPLDGLAGEDEFYELPDEAGDDGEDGEPHTALPTRVEAWRQRSATGAILTGFALGLQQVFEPKRDEPAVIMETSGEPPKDLPVEADFEYGRPKQSIVNVRPWLLPGADTDPEAVRPPADGDSGTDGRHDNGEREA